MKPVPFVLFGLSIFLLLASRVTAVNTYGPSDIVLTRIWHIEGEPGSTFELEGILAINSSDQRITFQSFTPGMEFASTENGAVKARYEGTLQNTSQEVYVRIEVRVDRHSGLPADVPFRQRELPATSLTTYDRAMQKQAQELTDGASTYQTLIHLVEWVHGRVQYDATYWGRNEKAQAVFKDGRGVCVEYSHLLISLLRSVGLNTRYVSGYVKAYEWQPHAWVQVELPDGRWIDADPTFNELGNLDNTHLAMFYGEDQTDIFDSVRSIRPVQLNTREEVHALYLDSRSPPDYALAYAFDNRTGSVSISIDNLHDEPRLVMYSLSLPETYLGNRERILLLQPGEHRSFIYITDPSSFHEGFVYQIPFSAYADDVVLEGQETLARPLPEEPAPAPAGLPFSSSAISCPVSLLLFAFITVGTMAIRNAPPLGDFRG